MSLLHTAVLFVTLVYHTLQQAKQIQPSFFEITYLLITGFFLFRIHEAVPTL